MDAVEAVRELSPRVGAPSSAGRLTLFPLSGAPPAPDYLTFAYARACGLAAVSEVSAEGEVPSLRVRNQAALPVLLVEGEILLGLKQNRVLDVTVLVPAGRSVQVPVACVEMGRWRHSPPPAEASYPAHLSPRVRATKHDSMLTRSRRTGELAPDQGAVWSRIGQALAEHRVAAPTASVTEIAASRRGEIQALIEDLLPEPDQCGVLAAVGGRFLGGDLFDRPETLAELWEGLLTSYAEDALVDRARPRATGQEAAAAWLEGLLAGPATAHPAPGLGETVALACPRGGASALVVQGRVVHLALFAAATAPRARFAPPSRRRS